MDPHSLEAQLFELKNRSKLFGCGWSAVIEAKLFTDGLHFEGNIEFRNGNPSGAVTARSRKEAEERCRDLAEKGAGTR